jgi:hypothetical protein
LNNEINEFSINLNKNKEKMTNSSKYEQTKLKEKCLNGHDEKEITAQSNETFEEVKDESKDIFEENKDTYLLKNNNVFDATDQPNNNKNNNVLSEQQDRLNEDSNKLNNDAELSQRQRKSKYPDEIYAALKELVHSGKSKSVIETTKILNHKTNSSFSKKNVQ